MRGSVRASAIRLADITAPSPFTLPEAIFEGALPRAIAKPVEPFHFPSAEISFSIPHHETGSTRLKAEARLAAFLLVLAALPARAEDTTLRGLWSTNSNLCREGSNGWDNLTVTDDKADWREGGCDFSGGIKENDYHWVMKGKCCSEGECQDFNRATACSKATTITP